MPEPCTVTYPPFMLELARCCGTCHFFERYKPWGGESWLKRLLNKPPEVSLTCTNPEVKAAGRDTGTHPELACGLWELCRINKEEEDRLYP